MKRITIAVALGLMFAVQSALAVDGAIVMSKGDGMTIAEELLLREDLSEPAPAKEEKADQKKKAKEDSLDEAPLQADAVESEDVTAEAAAPAGDVSEKLAQAAEAPAGTLEYEMDTVSLLADAPSAPAFEAAPKEASLAKR